jgi:hypothetical protein
MNRNEAKISNGASQGQQPSSMLPPSVKNPMCQIANLCWPEEWRTLTNLEKESVGFAPFIGPLSLEQSLSSGRPLLHSPYSRKHMEKSGELAWVYRDRQLIPAAKAATKELWPELWSCSEPLEVLRYMRRLLQKFWSADNQRARDWYIHRAREYYQRVFILPKTSSRRNERDDAEEQCRSASTKEEFAQAVSRLSSAYEWLNIEAESLLDDPPQSSRFEDALFKLQKRSQIPEQAPARCKNPKCPHPYFLKTDKQRKYWAQSCYHQFKLAKGRKDWHNKYKKNRKGGRNEA